jgi:hypothetical protein
VSDQPSSKDLTSMYTERIRDDLARVDEEIAAARALLDKLTADRGWLVGLLGHLPPTPEGDGGAVSMPRETTASHDTSIARADEPTSGPRTPPEQAVRVSGVRRRRGNGPTLRDLVMRHLENGGAPVTVHEATVQVNSTGEVRQASTVVVRNTLEALVARGIAQRSKEGRSVYYSLPADAEA